MTEDPKGRELAQGAIERARVIRTRVTKYRVDPSNYWTTHDQLNADEEEAKWFEDVGNALLDALEREERTRDVWDASLRGAEKMLREQGRELKRKDEALREKYETFRSLQRELRDIRHELDDRIEYWDEENGEVREELEYIDSKLKAAIFNYPNKALAPKEEE